MKSQNPSISHFNPTSGYNSPTLAPKRFISRTSEENSYLWIACCGYCLWECIDLISAWRSTPVDRLNGLLFFIWIQPFFRQLIHNQIQDIGLGHSISKKRLILSILFTFVGRIGDLNVLQHIGLTMVISSIFPITRSSFFWLVAAVSWMPGFSWICYPYLQDYLQPIRYILVSFCLFPMFIPNRFEK